MRLKINERNQELLKMEVIVSAGRKIKIYDREGRCFIEIVGKHTSAEINNDGSMLVSTISGDYN